MQERGLQNETARTAETSDCKSAKEWESDETELEW